MAITASVRVAEEAAHGAGDWQQLHLASGGDTADGTTRQVAQRRNVLRHREEGDGAAARAAGRRGEVSGGMYCGTVRKVTAPRLVLPAVERGQGGGYRQAGDRVGHSARWDWFLLIFG